MNFIAKFFHEFANPHCSHCEGDKICQSCETLKEQLAAANIEKNKLLDLILEKNKVVNEEPAKEIDYQSVKPKYIPWNVRKELLEAEDRERARIQRDKLAPNSKEQKEIDKLEQEIGIAPGATEKQSQA